MDLLIAAIHDEHEFLFFVPRESHPPCRAPRVRHIRSSRPDPDVPLKLAHIVEHLHAIALTVTYVYQSGVAHRDAMNDLRKDGRVSPYRFFLRCLTSPLP